MLHLDGVLSVKEKLNCSEQDHEAKGDRAGNGFREALGNAPIPKYVWHQGLVWRTVLLYKELHFGELGSGVVAIH